MSEELDIETPPVEVAIAEAPDAPETAEASAMEEPFDTPVRTQPEESHNPDALIVNLDGFEGPMDLLLELARKQKVDLRKISILALVEQYLEFVEEARQRKLELAADYLVMASWLTYLKSKMLLPKTEEVGEEPTADEMASRLAFQLQRLEAMRSAADRLMDMPQKNIHFFPRGNAEGVRVIKTPDWTADIYDLLQAYTTQRVKAVDATIKFTPPKVFQIEEARARLAKILGAIPEWSDLSSLTFGDVDAPRASIIASAFNASLEFAKAGQLDLRQAGAFQPLYIKHINEKSQVAPEASQQS